MACQAASQSSLSCGAEAQSDENLRDNCCCLRRGFHRQQTAGFLFMSKDRNEVFSVSPQNKPSVTLREPSRRGHSGLSSAWHPAPLLPTGTGQGAVRLRVALQRSACQSSWLLACPAVAGLSLEQAEHNSLVLRALVPPKPGKNASCKASALSHCWRKALPDQQGL